MINEEKCLDIAVISFAYENPILIGKLKQRGNAIAQGKFAQIDKLDEEIDSLIREKKD